MSLEEMMQDAAAEQVAEADLGAISEIAQDQLNLQKEIENLEKLLATAKDTLNTFQTERLPNAMLEAGLTSLGLEGGATVSLTDTYGCSIIKDVKDNALNHLVNIGHGDIIKCKVIVEFDRTEFEEALELEEELDGRGLTVYTERGVHHATLKSWFKNNPDVQEGVLPDTLFHTFLGQKATIK